MNLYQLDVFTTTPGQGNPTGVALDAALLSTAQMQQLAADLKMEMAFVLTARNGGGFWFRYFSPQTEMNLCAHATIGALWFLALQGHLSGETTIETAAGSLACRVEFADDNPALAFMSTPAPIFESGDFNRDEVAAALGLAPGQINGPLVAASTGRPKLLIPLPDYQTLDAIRPDPAVHPRLCQRHHLTGLYPYTLTPRNRSVAAEARQFPYGIGLEEDPVTGVAIAALAAWLVQSGTLPPTTRLTIEQGHAVSRPGRAEVTLHLQNGQLTALEVGGQAVLNPGWNYSPTGDRAIS